MFADKHPAKIHSESKANPGHPVDEYRGHCAFNGCKKKNAIGRPLPWIKSGFIHPGLTLVLSKDIEGLRGDMETFLRCPCVGALGVVHVDLQVGFT